MKLFFHKKSKISDILERKMAQYKFQNIKKAVHQRRCQKYQNLHGNNPCKNSKQATNLKNKILYCHKQQNFPQKNKSEGIDLNMAYKKICFDTSNSLSVDSIFKENNNFQRKAAKCFEIVVMTKKVLVLILLLARFCEIVLVDNQI